VHTVVELLARPWPFWVAGFALGAFVPLFALATGKALGISSGYADACDLAGPARDRWKLWFVLGLPLGGLLGASSEQTAALETSVARFTALGVPLGAQLGLLFAGGVLVGFGARLAGGCTSGHSIVGVAQGAKASLIATLGFMVGGFATAQLLFRWLEARP